MIVIVIRPTLSCIFRVVSRCDHSNSAGNRLGPRGILFRRVRRWCRHRHIGTLQVIPFTLKLRSFPVLNIPIWIPVFAAPPTSASATTQASALTPALTPASSPVILVTIQFIPLIVPVIVPPLAIFSFFLSCPSFTRFRTGLLGTRIFLFSAISFFLYWLLKYLFFNFLFFLD